MIDSQIDVGAVAEQNDKGDEQPVNNEEVSCEKSEKASGLHLSRNNCPRIYMEPAKD